MKICSLVIELLHPETDRRNSLIAEGIRNQIKNNLKLTQNKLHLMNNLNKHDTSLYVLPDDAQAPALLHT